MVVHLSGEAMSVLRHRLNGQRVAVTAESLGAYRELAGAGLMEPVSGFAGGNEAHFRITKAARDREAEWITAPPETMR